MLKASKIFRIYLETKKRLNDNFLSGASITGQYVPADEFGKVHSSEHV